jgi:hypothetical protein
MITTEREMEFTPKLSTDMFPSPRNSPSTLFLMDFSLKKPRNGLGGLGAYQGKKKARGNEGEGQAIYRENPPPTP